MQSAQANERQKNEKNKRSLLLGEKIWLYDVRLLYIGNNIGAELRRNIPNKYIKDGGRNLLYRLLFLRTYNKKKVIFQIIINFEEEANIDRYKTLRRRSSR
uniref:Uncharacterized protein n=1 Tax=Aureoumbra lagunensis TaxID=44058 RepID=A0A7S3K3M9_9STRA